MISGTLKSLLGGAFVFALLCRLAFANDAPDCAMIREKVKEHGRVAAYAWALANGYSPKDIARIRKQCGV